MSNSTSPKIEVNFGAPERSAVRDPHLCTPCYTCKTHWCYISDKKAHKNVEAEVWMILVWNQDITKLFISLWSCKLSNTTTWSYMQVWKYDFPEKTYTSRDRTDINIKKHRIQHSILEQKQQNPVKAKLGDTKRLLKSKQFLVQNCHLVLLPPRVCKCNNQEKRLVVLWPW